MKRILFAVIAISFMLALSGCGDGSSNPPPRFESQIISSPNLDGDIELDTANILTVTQGNLPSLFAGIDPVTGSEFRAFLFFPLTGVNGVPGNAIIESATLDIFIDNIAILPAAGSIPVRIELVSFSPPTLLASDYDLPALAATTIRPPISRSDIGRNVSVDVTSLMVEAQRRGLANFQLRILEDFGPVFPGLIEINDATNDRAPLLTVVYL